MDLRAELQSALGAGFTVEREISGAGMSRVFVVTDHALRRRLVAKVLPPALQARLSVDRFLREIELVAGLHHPYIVPLLTASAAGRLLYFTMPYVSGESLRDRLLALGTAGERMSVSSAVRLAADAAEALGAAHARGFVHRDVKPGNILLTADGEHAVVTDFGIARALDEATLDGRGATGVETAGSDRVVVGTPAYMSPEQALHHDAVDARSDVYSLGCVLYEMLAGRPPFTGSRQEVLEPRLTGVRPAPVARLRPDVPPAIEQVVMRALEPRAADRFPTAGAFRDALLRAAEPPRGVARRLAQELLALVVAVLVVVAVALLLRRPSGPMTANHEVPNALDSDLVAVAPFQSIGRVPALADWEYGIPVVLWQNLDGAGALRAVPPSTYPASWRPRADAGAADTLAVRTHARFIVYGTLAPAGGDTTRLTAAVYDAATRQNLDVVEITARDMDSHMAQVTDSLTKAVLDILSHVRVLGATRRASLGSTVSYPALKAFVRGERFYRLAMYDSALEAYTRAVRFDSTFALAYSHAGRVLGWLRESDDSLATAYALRAGALNHGLGPHDSLLVLADSLFAALEGSPGPADATWWASARRIFATLDEAVHRYADDPLAWYELGDARMHFGGPLGARPDGVLDALDRSIALDSAFSPAYVHPVELALEAGDEARARRYVDAYLHLEPVDKAAGGMSLVGALLRTPERVPPFADTTSAKTLVSAHIATRRWPDRAAARAHGAPRARRLPDGARYGPRAAVARAVARPPRPPARRGRARAAQRRVA